MKKKIFLMVAVVAMLVCLFAISASAAEPAYNDGEWIYAADGTTKLAIRDTEGNPLIWYLNGDEIKYVRADQTDETQAVYVKYSISAGGSGFNTSVFNPTKCLKSIRIYDNGTEIICSSDNKDIQKALLFNFEKLDIDALNGWLWGNKNGCCPNLRGIVLPSTLKGIGQEGFTNTKLVQIWNLENTQLFYINACDFAATSTLTQEATGGVLKNPQTLPKPLNVQGAQIVKYIMNPYFNHPTMNQQWNQYFRSCSKLKEIYVPAGANIGFGNEAFRSTPNQYIVFMSGSQTDAENMILNTNDSHNGGFKAAKVISYETYLGDKATYDNATNQVYVVYGYNFCDAFYDGNHDDIGNDCVIECNRCDDYDGDMKENPKHNYVNAIAYTNYLANGVKTQTCQNKGCEHNTKPFETSVNPIITEFKGFSVSEKGDGITFGYSFDKAAISEFEAVNGKIELGFVVAVKAFAGNDAYTSDKAIKAAVTNDEIAYTGADFILRGTWDKMVDLDGDETAETDVKDVEFYMAGYILVNGTATYLNSNGSGNSADVITFDKANTPSVNA